MGRQPSQRQPTLTTKSKTKQRRKMISKLSVTPQGGLGLFPRNRGSDDSLEMKQRLQTNDSILNTHFYVILHLMSISILFIFILGLNFNLLSLSNLNWGKFVKELPRTRILCSLHWVDIYFPITSACSTEITKLKISFISCT